MPQRPNIVFVMTDQQRFRTLGCCGVPEARTPNLDRLAAGGVLFRNHIVTNPVCSPSRASIFTGQYITEHGLWANGCTLPPEHRTIPRALGEAGYQTAHFGKLHLIPIVNRTERHPPYGFEVCEVAEGDQQLISDDYFNWLRKTDPALFVDYVNEMYTQGHAKGYTSRMPEQKHLSTWVTGRAIDWLKNRREKGGADGRPFFLSVGYFDPHHAFNPCEPYASLYDDIDVAPPVWREGAVDTKPVYYRKFVEGLKVAREAAKITRIIKCYHAMVAHIDKCVGDLLAALEQQGIADSTVVIFTSDHGELLGNHGLLWKGPYLLDDLLRVPLVVSIPGRPRKGVETDELTSGVDIMATILSLAGAADGPVESGVPFLDAELGLFPHGPREYALCEWEHWRNPGNGSLRCIRTKTHKLVHYNNDDCGELYDLAADPDEFVNHYDDPAYADVKTELCGKLTHHYLSRRPRVPYEGGW